MPLFLFWLAIWLANCRGPSVSYTSVNKLFCARVSTDCIESEAGKGNKTQLDGFYRTEVSHSKCRAIRMSEVFTKAAPNKALFLRPCDTYKFRQYYAMHITSLLSMTPHPTHIAACVCAPGAPPLSTIVLTVPANAFKFHAMLNIHSKTAEEIYDGSFIGRRRCRGQDDGQNEKCPLGRSFFFCPQSNCSTSNYSPTFRGANL